MFSFSSLDKHSFTKAMENDPNASSTNSKAIDKSTISEYRDGVLKEMS